jgi:acetolactate synthase regulatory subunit
MTIPLTDILNMVFQRSAHVNMSQYANDIKTFNILLALDGKRSVNTVAEQDAYDPDELAARVRTLWDLKIVESVTASTVPKGHAKKILDAIIQKRSRGVGSIAKAIKIKLALKGINPDRLTPDTPDDPVLLKKLLALARSYGLQVVTKSDHSKGKTRLILDSIITQRSGGDPMIAKLIRTKLMLKGINPDAYSLDTPDDPNLVNRLMELANKLGVKIPTKPSRIGKQIEQML